jgi:hypothetical protein
MSWVPFDLEAGGWSILLAGHVLCVAVVVAGIFFRRRWLRPIAVVAGAAALWLPLFALLDTLGLPNPYPPPGDYRLISSRYDASSEMLYMFVDTMGRDFTPRVYAMFFDRSKYDRLDRNADYNARILRLFNSAGGDFDVVYVDYEPPDLLKDDMMRGWQAPREDD